MPFGARVHIEPEFDHLTLLEHRQMLDDIYAIYERSLAATTDDDLVKRKIGDPLVSITTGSVWIDILANSDAPEAAQTVALFAAVLSTSPWLAGLPHRVKERWYSDAAKAAAAKKAYEELRQLGPITIETMNIDRRATPSRSRSRSRSQERQQQQRRRS